MHTIFYGEQTLNENTFMKKKTIKQQNEYFYNEKNCKKAEMTCEMWFTFIALRFAYSRQLFLWEKKPIL